MNSNAKEVNIYVGANIPPDENGARRQLAALIRIADRLRSSGD